jgi:tetratricopeptide (TPR) repeat protein
MKFLQMCSLVLGVVLVASASAAQTPTMASANELFTKAKWPEAAAAYQAITAADSQNAVAWRNLGESLLQQHQSADAVTAFERALALHSRRISNQVNIARAYADMMDRPKSLAQLQQLVDSGNAGLIRPIVLSAAEFKQWKDDPEFQALVAKMAPCQSPEYRKFDFWIGDWEVQGPQGQPAGHNLVTLEQEGCLLIEHWTATTGGQTGTSYNYYDVRDKLWHQLYLDNSGNAGAFPAMAGTLTNGKMVLLTDQALPSVSRWTWYTLAPGKVRQMAEQSTDGQKTWKVTWDSVYLERK